MAAALSVSSQGVISVGATDRARVTRKIRLKTRKKKMMLNKLTINERSKKNAASTAIKRAILEGTASNDASLAADLMTDVTGIGTEDAAEVTLGTEAGAEIVDAIAVKMTVTNADAAEAGTAAMIVVVIAAVTVATAVTEDAGDLRPLSPSTAETTDAMYEGETIEGATTIAAEMTTAEIVVETITDVTTTEATVIEGTVGVNAETGEEIAEANRTTRARVRTTKLPTILIKKTSATRTEHLIAADPIATRTMAVPEKQGASTTRISETYRTPWQSRRASPCIGSERST